MSLPPIPGHLARYDWYAPHLAWLVSQGLMPRHDPGGTAPVRAILSGVDLSGADLIYADLRFYDLSGAHLSGAHLGFAYLDGACLDGATGIASAGPVGRQGRIIYAVRHGDEVMIQAGCWWGTAADTEARIMRNYDGDPWRDAYLAAVRFVAASVMVAP